MADAEYELEMRAIVTIKTGQRLLFTPHASDGGDREWADFAKTRYGEDCKLLHADLRNTDDDIGEPALQMNALLRDISGPSFVVRFEDGTERAAASRHFTLPMTDE